MQQIVAAAVDVGHGHNGVARLQEGAEDAVYRRHAAAEGKACRAVFQRGNRVFQNLARGVGKTGITERYRLTQLVLDEHTVLIKRGHDGAVVLIGVIGGVDDIGGKFHGFSFSRLDKWAKYVFRLPENKIKPSDCMSKTRRGDILRAPAETVRPRMRKAA